MVGKIFVILVVLIPVQRLLELERAKHNEHKNLIAGAKEFGAAHYPYMVLLHLLWFFGWIWEAILTGLALHSYWYIFLILFIVAQGLRYWVILTLGSQWNTKIIVLPNAPKIRKGPYHFLKHPNYVAVALELFCVPMIFGAWRTAIIATILNAILLLGFRIPAENAAMKRSEESKA